MTKTDKKTLKAMLHALECYYPVLNEWSILQLYSQQEAAAHNEKREQLLSDATKLVKKLCRKPKPRVKPRDPRLKDHFV